MKQFALTLVALLALIVSVPVSAATVAHWDFDTDGMADGDYMLGNASTAGSYNYSVEDLSGNNNHLCAWTDTWMLYSADTYMGHGLSITASNDWPDARTDNNDNPYTIGINAETITPLAWTVEALFKSTDLSGNRTIVGRDGYHVGGNTSSAAALYLSTRGTELAIDYTDVTGTGHGVQIAAGLETDTWYHVAGVSDGTTLYLYLDGELLGSTDLSGSTDPSLGLGDTDGAWTVSCGQWDQGAVDRFFGLIDEVAISNAALSPGNFVAGPAFYFLSPADESTLVDIDLDSADNDLIFTVNNADIAVVDVLFGTDEEPNIINGTVIVDDMAVSTGEYTVDLESEISSLSNETTYYWTVIGYEPNSVSGLNNIPVQGPVWSFTTAPAQPIVSDVTPAYSAVEVGGEVTLEVEAHNGDIVWYKEGYGSLIGVAGYNGADSETLVIEDVQEEDEGYYYCKVSNLADEDQSSSARVLTKRLMSSYSFEATSVNTDSNTITPDAVEGFDMLLLTEAAVIGEPSLEPNVVTSSLGTYSLLFDNDPEGEDPNNMYGAIPAGAIDYEDVTVSFWVYPMGGSIWHRVFDFGSGTDSYMFFTPDNGSGYSRFAIKVDGGSEQNLDASWLAANQWYYVAITMDGNTGRLYIDGELVDTNTEMDINPIDLEATLNYIGKSQFDVDDEFNGLIDELQIYNYAKTTVDIGEDYISVVGGWVCNNELASLPYDYNDDCIVDLIDFATFAETWLDSNRITLSE